LRRCGESNHLTGLRFIDETLRDGPQSLWATRISTQTMLEATPLIRRAGFDRVTVMSAACFEVAVKFMKDDPWERLRLMRAHLPGDCLDALIRGRTLFGWTQYPDEVVEVLFRCLQRNGIDSVKIFDGLNDINNIAAHCRIGKKLGLHTTGIISYSVSPIHTGEHFADKARRFVELDVDGILIVDASGMMTGDAAASLVAAIDGAIGGAKPIEFYVHCATGTAHDAYRAAMQAGVRTVTTAAEPLANGDSQPAARDVVRIAEELGIPIDLDMDAVTALDEFMRWIAYRERKPVPGPIAFDAAEYAKFVKHQIPGGMMSNFRNQLREAGIADRFDEVLEEVGRVRAELGYPIMITPFSQFVGVQATLNVIQGERYKTVPTELRLYALGYYGDSGAPVDPNVLDRILGGKSEERLHPEAGFSARILDEFRKTNGPFRSDEELILHLFYGADTVKTLERDKTNPRRIEAMKHPLRVLVEEIAKQSQVRSFSITMPNRSVRMETSLAAH
jgi:oxaloacetate decarboxylase alpha subunit